MRAVKFKRTGGGRVARPFRGWEYRITGNHDEGYVLCFNGIQIGKSERVDLLRDLATIHLRDGYVSPVATFMARH